MTEPLSIDLDGLAENVVAGAWQGRRLIAIAGAPGSGKSTLAEHLKARLNDADAGSASILPMDGYHLDDGILIARGLRARKGAPETFDVGGLLHMLARLKRNEEAEIAVPVFDRSLEISRAGARLIPQTVRHLIIEGNYLLLGMDPWKALHPLYDLTVAVLVPEETLRRRLIDRCRGYNIPPEEITAKVERNDLPNGRFVMSSSVPAQFTVSY